MSRKARADQLQTSSVNREQLDQQGFCALHGLISTTQLTAMRQRLEEKLGETPQSHAGTLIVGDLLNEQVFDSAWNHPAVFQAVEAVLGKDYLLLGLSSRGIRPGHGQQALHSDWGGQGCAGVWYVCHAICALVDFTAENGATRVIPGSHRDPGRIKRIQDPRRPQPDEQVLEGPAGTIFILNVHCLHSAVRNNSRHDRLALFASFTRNDSPLLETSGHRDPESHVLTRFSAEVRKRLMRP